MAAKTPRWGRIRFVADKLKIMHDSNNNGGYWIVRAGFKGRGQLLAKVRVESSDDMEAKRVECVQNVGKKFGAVYVLKQGAYRGA